MLRSCAYLRSSTDALARLSLVGASSRALFSSTSSSELTVEVGELGFYMFYLIYSLSNALND
jgi:hypothetical protein